MKMYATITLLILALVSWAWSAESNATTVVSNRLTEAQMIAIAERFAAADSNCWQTVSNVLLYVRADTNQQLRTIQVDATHRTVCFRENLIPCDGPVTTVSVTLREDGSLDKIEKKVQSEWPPVIPLPSQKGKDNRQPGVGR